MTIRELLRTSGLAALAAAMVVSALPAQAAAPNNDNRGNWSRGSGDRGSVDRGSRGSDNRSAETRNRASVRSDNGNDNRRAERPAPQRPNVREDRRPAPVPQSNARPRPVAPAPQNTPPRQGYRQNDGNRGPVAGAPGSIRGNNVRPQGTDDRSRYNDRNRNNDRDRERLSNWRGSGVDRPDPRRDNDRNGANRGRDHNSSYNDRNHNRDHRNWDRKWRNDHRYDWRDYRASHRHVYRLGNYYSPYRNYNYRRLSIGIFLDNLFYSNRYWINDPYYYRLPPAYGPYRWVRYYDDALLVDIYSGEVVDVIHDFFW